MDVEDPPGESIDELPGQDAHETGENNAFGTRILHRVGKSGRECGPRFVVGPPNDIARYPCLPSPLEGPCIWLVRHDLRNAGPDVRCIDQSLEVGARARSQNCDVDARPPRMTDAASVGPGNRLSVQPTYDDTR